MKLNDGLFHDQQSSDTAVATKRCVECGLERPLVLFPRPMNYSAVCQACTSEGLAILRRRDLRPIASPRAGPWDYRKLSHKATTLVGRARIASRKANLPFNLSPEWALTRLQNRRCEVTNIQFDMNFGFRGQCSPSVDRIVPALGYTEENCRMVVWMYNAAKGGGTHDDVLKLAEALRPGARYPSIVTQIVERRPRRKMPRHAIPIPGEEHLYEVPFSP